jgi:hypothetical protein
MVRKQIDKINRLEKVSQEKRVKDAYEVIYLQKIWCPCQPLSFTAPPQEQIREPQTELHIPASLVFPSRVRIPGAATPPA